MSSIEARGLAVKDGSFWLNGSRTRLFSGAVHYFRIPREYWRDRLMKLRACGCNAVETYIPWNAHEPKQGTFDFESDMLDVRTYVRLAEECGLYVIIRPGPYICAEWDLGGLPSWLLRDENMKLRSTYSPFMDAVKSYFSVLLPKLTDLQYSSNGGPVIAWQIENEYGSFGDDTDYLIQLQSLMSSMGCTELMFTSDNEQGISNGAVDGVLMTANFQEVELGRQLLTILQDKQPDMPRMCMEFWTGWFDHWGDERHQTWSLEDFETTLRYILEEYGSVNFYMFHGGTNFAFMNGANEQTENDQLKNGTDYQADVTSYDYDAPVSEEGRLTQKYYKAKELMSQYREQVVYLSNDTPTTPDIPAAITHGDIKFGHVALMEELLPLLPTCHLSGQAKPMECLDINDGSGQAYGFTLYRKSVARAGHVKVEGAVRDRTQVLLNAEPLTTFDCNALDVAFSLPSAGVLDLLVENMGRTNYQPINKDVLNTQRKGLNTRVVLDSEVLEGWQSYSLEFTADFIDQLHKLDLQTVNSPPSFPALLTAELELEMESPPDTFLDMTGWGKGIVIVNGRNLGRYWPDGGPTQTLYLPGVWLKRGKNQVIVFELEKAPWPCVIASTSQPKLDKH